MGQAGELYEGTGPGSGRTAQHDQTVLHKDWEAASEEQKSRIAQLKAQTDKLTGNNSEVEDMSEIEGDIYGGEQ